MLFYNFVNDCHKGYQTGCGLLVLGKNLHLWSCVRCEISLSTIQGYRYSYNIPDGSIILKGSLGLPATLLHTLV